MEINQLMDIMISYGIVLRAIPYNIQEVYEKRHIDKYPNGEIKYLDEYKREMLVVNRTPKNAGKFCIEVNQGVKGLVKFTGEKFYNSIEEAINDIELKKG